MATVLDGLTGAEFYHTIFNVQLTPFYTLYDVCR